MTKQAQQAQHVRRVIGIVGGIMVVLSLVLLVMALGPFARRTERLQTTVEPTLFQRPN